MGVPAFFRWLSKKYASIIMHSQEEKNMVDGQPIPVDASAPNPNGVEFDNLYLDMNGIIHPCCHPEDKPAPKDEDEMMVAIFEYIDRIFNIVRPRKLLYMAIDGVAPRAKMNQQRSRRFRSSKESREKVELIKKIREDRESEGYQMPPEKKSDSHFDSNCITPGTTFMAHLAKALRYYVHKRMNEDAAWKGVKVILSDSNVPGEGEHKIMDYIRKQRAAPDHDPNTHHCLYGADADLIMLGLATHEPHFSILREEFKPVTKRPCEICNQYGHEMKECTGQAREKQGEHDEFAVQDTPTEKEFIFIRLNILREYLERELRMDGLSFPFDLERAIDDWVFMCFFVGNDFLPHLPSLEIREGAIDRLIRLYKTVVPVTGGYLTENGRVDLQRVQYILTELGKVEDEIFKRRRQQDIDFRRRQKERRKRQRNEYSAPKWNYQTHSEPKHPGYDSRMGKSGMGIRQEAYQARMTSVSAEKPSLNDANHLAATDLRNMLRKEPPSQSSSFKSMKRPPSGQGQGGSDSEEEPEDNVKLWEDGWKERYYRNKFDVSCRDKDFVRRVVEGYTRGLCWVFGYYYQGCPSWKWYYPFHYAPFASDFHNISEIPNDFDTDTEPFKPLEQLMGVFPAASAKFLPPSWRLLMTEPDSPIIDFYPVDFRVDLNGKKYAWQGVALLPFVDEKRLLKALEDLYPDLEPEEVERNSLGSDRLFVHHNHPSYRFILSVYEDYDFDQPLATQPVVLDASLTQGMSGLVEPDNAKENCPPGSSVESPIPTLEPIKQNQVVCVKYQDLEYPKGFIYKPNLLPNVRMPAAVLKPGNHVGPYRPQTGFTPPDQSRSYSSPQSTQRFVRSALSDPQSRSPYDEYGRRGMEPSSAWQPGPPMGHYQQQDPYYSTPYRHGYSDDYYGPTKDYSSSRQGPSSLQWAPYSSVPPPNQWQGYPPHSHTQSYAYPQRNYSVPSAHNYPYSQPPSRQGHDPRQQRW
jgi:5'-3' exoribonuclease 2